MEFSTRKLKEAGRPRWGRYLLGTVCASALFAGLWGLTAMDWRRALVGAVLPWAVVAASLFVSLVWAAVMAPLLMLVGKAFGEKPGREGK